MMEVDLDVNLDTLEASIYIENEIKNVLNEIIIQIEKNISLHKPTKPIEPNNEIHNIFSFVNTCNSCSTQNSFFWRRVARTKIVCNKCFFTQTYLLLFNEANSKKENLALNDELSEVEPIKYSKKTRATSRNIHEFSIQNVKCLTENDVTKTSKSKNLSSQFSSSSSTSSSYSSKNQIKNENDDYVDDYNLNGTRKSARFISSLNKQNESKNKKVSNNKKASIKSSMKNESIASIQPDIDNTSLNAQHKTISPNNTRSRRSKLFKSEKSVPIKCEELISTIVTSEFLFHRGFYMQVGDIVALFDSADTERIPYFAQIRAFLTDQYGEKSAVITWLVPINSEYAKRIHSAKDFDPDMFVLGNVPCFN
jgi:hypothetical protein